MIPATLLALVTATAPAAAPPARVFLKASAAGAPSCRTTRVDAQLVSAGLFAPESEQCPVANVGDESIVLRELAEALELKHLSRSPRSAAPARLPDMDFTAALDRLIASRLLVQEARAMGLDEDPRHRTTLEEFRAGRLRAALQRSAARGAKPDPAEVERLYREAVREWKVKSIHFKKEDDAKAFVAALKGGGSFDALAKKFVGEKRAEGGGPAEFVPPKHTLPEVGEALRAAKRGVPVGPIAVPTGWVMLRIDGVRYPPKDAAAREDARARSLARVEHEAVRRFYLSLVAKYARVDARLLEQLDFEKGGEAGFQALLADGRPLATIRGEEPITVGDLTREISLKFFHGMKGPIEQKRVNREKADTFERLLGARLFAKEAAARKLDATPEHRREVAEHERMLLFNAFVEKVLVPDVKVSEQDALGWYDAHKAEYTTPQMYKLEALAFPSAREAQAALDKLKAGTDFAWLRSTAPGQLAPEQRTLQLDGQTLSATALPKDLASALTGARSGEYRLHVARASEAYVVRVAESRPPVAQPYVEAREAIAKQLWNERLAAAIRDYAERVRKAQPVDVLITRVTL